MALDRGSLQRLPKDFLARRPRQRRSAGGGTGRRTRGTDRRLLRWAHAARHLGMSIRLVAEVIIEVVCDRLDVARIASRSRSPFAGEIPERYRGGESLVPVGQHTPYLHLARALGDRAFDDVAGVEQKMLEVRPDAQRHSREALSVLAVTGGAETSEIVLRGPDVAGPVLVPHERERAGLEDHLEEGIVPADVQVLAVPYVLDRDRVEAVVKPGVPGPEERRQPPRCRTGRHPVLGAGLDGRQRLRDGRCGHDEADKN